jgi:hypothetical protein
VLAILDLVIVPDTDEWRFDGHSIVSVQPTPATDRPPLAIAETSELTRAGIWSMADVMRSMLFLRDDVETGPDEEGDDEPTDRWAPDLDPCVLVDQRAVLTPGGWRIPYQPLPGAAPAHAVVAHPRSAMLWDDILASPARAEDGATLRDLLATLRDLDDRTLAYVQGYLRLWPAWQLTGVVQAALTVPPAAQRDPDVDEIVVGWRCTTDATEGDGPDELFLSPDASMKGPAQGDAACSDGRWSLWGAPWSTALDLPLRFDSTVVVPPVHDEVMAFLSHERERARGAGEIELTRRPLPERDRYAVRITWADTLGEILSELGPFEAEQDVEQGRGGTPNAR